MLHADIKKFKGDIVSCILRKMYATIDFSLNLKKRIGQGIVCNLGGDEHMKLSILPDSPKSLKVKVRDTNFCLTLTSPLTSIHLTIQYMKYIVFVWGLLSHSRIFHSFGDVTITGEGLQILPYARHSLPS